MGRQRHQLQKIRYQTLLFLTIPLRLFPTLFQTLFPMLRYQTL